MTKPITKQLEEYVVTILTMKPIYTKPGTSEEDSRQVELIHKRDEFLALISQIQLDLLKTIESEVEKEKEKFYVDEPEVNAYKKGLDFTIYKLQLLRDKIKENNDR